MGENGPGRFSVWEMNKGFWQFSWGFFFFFLLLLILLDGFGVARFGERFLVWIIVLLFKEMWFRNVTFDSQKLFSYLEFLKPFKGFFEGKTHL